MLDVPLVLFVGRGKKKKIEGVVDKRVLFGFGRNRFHPIVG